MYPRSFRRCLAMMTVAMVAGFPFVACAASTNAVPSRATSASRQFTAYAADPLFSSTLCVFAERVKRAWLAELDLRDEWQDPIIIALHERDSSMAEMPPVRVDAFRNEIHLKYQITCIVPPPLDRELMVVAVVETLCDEFANRNQPTSQTADYIRAPIPPWLALALSESLRSSKDSLLEAARRSVNAGRPQTASELIMARLPMDSGEADLFRANSWILTQGLLSLPNGPEKMRYFLVGLGVTKSITNAFSLAYGLDFPQEVTFEKWWSLQLAQCTAKSVAQNLPLEETSHRLDEILPTRLVQDQNQGSTGAGRQVSFAQLWRYYETPWLQDVLKAKFNDLQMLQSDAHPLYRPVIDGYLQAVLLLMDHKLSRFRRAVAAADLNRAAVDRKAKEILAYLDKAEKAYSPEEFTDLFSGYFQAMDKMEKMEQKRRDPISDYLDQFDR